MGCFLKALPNVKSAYVTCKEFTPNLQIFYTFLIFGFDVQVSGLKLPQWNTFIEFGLNVQVSGVILPHWNGPFSQSFTQRQKRVCYYQKIYPRPPKNLHRLICRICDISQLCPHLHQFFQVTGLTPLHNLLNLATAKPFLAYLHGQGQNQVDRLKCWFLQ